MIGWMIFVHYLTALLCIVQYYTFFISSKCGLVLLCGTISVIQNLSPGIQSRGGGWGWTSFNIKDSKGGHFTAGGSLQGKSWW